MLTELSYIFDSVHDVPFVEPTRQITYRQDEKIKHK